MYEVKLYDKSFIGCGPSAGTGQTKKAPSKIKWYTGNETKRIGVFTDGCLQEVQRAHEKVKIAWLIEPRVVSPHIYRSVTYLKEHFDFVLTHDKELLKLGDKFIFTPLGGNWISDENCKVHPKTKETSIIASSKRHVQGHKMRHDIVRDYGIGIDGIFGHGYNPIDNKIIGLRDYRFHIVVENGKLDFWFTEKLIDAFATGCIPIYFGAPSIGRFFNSAGILTFSNMAEFHSIINTYANAPFYNNRLPAIKENFELSKKYWYPEDYMWENLIWELV